MTIQVRSEQQVPSRAIVCQLGVTEGAVRYHQRRAHEGATDGRKEKSFAASAFEPVIDVWLAEHARGDRPVNSRDLHEHLAREHGYPHSSKFVLRYVRERFGSPAIRTYRRVETVPGAQLQTDWGEFPSIDLGYVTARAIRATRSSAKRSHVSSAKRSHPPGGALVRVRAASPAILLGHTSHGGPGMAARRTDMHRLQEVTRLHRIGQSVRWIARQLAMGRNTIREYLMGGSTVQRLLPPGGRIEAQHRGSHCCSGGALRRE